MEESLLITACLGGLVIFLFWITRRQHIPASFPPGPPSLPVLGHLPFIAVFGLEPFLRWAGRKYGPAMTLWFGATPKIFINDVELARKALRHRAFAGRPHNDLAKLLEEGVSGLGFGDYCPRLQTQRLVLSKVVKRLLGSEMAFSKIAQKHADGLVSFLVKANKEPVNPTKEIGLTIGGIISEVFNGRDGDQVRKDSAYISFMYQNDYIGQFLPVMQLVDMWPRAKRFVQNSYGKLTETLLISHSYFRDLSSEREASYTAGVVNDSFDILMEEASKVDTEQRESQGILDDHLVYRLLMDINMGGLETVFRTTHWSLLYLASDPQTQDRLYNEIQAAGGNLDDFTDNFSHIQETLPLFTSFLTEVLRCSLVVPIALEHRVTEDTPLNKWQVKEGTGVFVNSIFFARDPNIWEEPDKFKAERFLNSSGEFNTILAESFLPFSTGRRRCPGEDIGRRILFILFATLVTGCRVMLPIGQVPDFQRNVLLFVEPRDFTVVAELRSGDMD